MSMRTVITASLLTAALVLPATPVSALEPIPANDPTSARLVEEPKRYDGTVVTFAGEAVGEAMVRGDDAWIHLNDDAYMERNVEEGAALGGYNSGMAVWLPASLTTGIDAYGDYKHEGSIVSVTGTFNAACAEHGGDMDIHATKAVVLRPGHDAQDPIRPWKAALAIGLALLAGAAWWVERSTRNRIRPHRGV